MPELHGLYGLVSAELREMYVDWVLLPALRDMVRKRPGTTQILVCFAQYWDDDANDEVHVFPLLLDVPWVPGQWPPEPPDDVMEAARGLVSAEWGERVAASEEELREYALRSWGDQVWIGWDAFRALHGGRLGYLAPTPGFAPFCKRNQDQRNPWWIRYAPVLCFEVPAWTMRWVQEPVQPELEDQFLFNTVRWSGDLVGQGPLQHIPLRALAAVPEVGGRVLSLLSVVERFAAAELAGQPGEGEEIEAYRDWGDGVVGL